MILPVLTYDTGKIKPHWSDTGTHFPKIIQPFGVFIFKTNYGLGTTDITK